MFRNKDKTKNQEPAVAPGTTPPPRGADEVAHGAPLDADQAAALVESLQNELDQANNKWKRALADFQNFQRRSMENEREARRQGLTAVLQSIIPVLDHFDLALSHDPANSSAEQVIDGVKVIREELIKALGVHGVGLINPAVNQPLDPHRHQAITHLAAEGVEPGHVAATLQVGYLLGERVVRPAKVAVAPARAETAAPEGGAGDQAGTEA
jgi:molecular chaperone GrpE